MTNQELESIMDTTDEWIRTRTGISERRVADVTEGTSDLAVAACRDALQDAGLRAKDLDLMIVATCTPDYFMPGLGVLIQNKLGCRPIPAIDLRGQCSGFAWALSTADAYSKMADYQYILVVGSDLQTRILDYSLDGRNSAVLFGDGAGACVLKVKKTLGESQPSGLLDHILGSDGSGFSHLMVPRPGCQANNSSFISHNDIDSKKTAPYMDGRQVFKYASYYMEKTVTELMARNKLSIDDIDLIIPHQANLRLSKILKTKLGIPPEKMVSVIEKFGNTTSASLPLCFVEARQSGKLKKGSLIITTTFGSGFTWGGNLIRW